MNIKELLQLMYDDATRMSIDGKKEDNPIALLTAHIIRHTCITYAKKYNIELKEIEL